MFSAALFCVYDDYQNLKQTTDEKNSPQSYKTQIKSLPFSGLVTEQLSPGDTVLGLPKSIYYNYHDSLLARPKKIRYIKF